MASKFATVRLHAGIVIVEGYFATVETAREYAIDLACGVMGRFAVASLVDGVALSDLPIVFEVSASDVDVRRFLAAREVA